MDGPETRWQCAELNTFYAALFDKGDRILEVVVRVLCAVGREDATRRHRFAVNRFDYAHLIRTNLDQGNFANDFFKRELDEMQARLKHISLNTDFSFRGYHSSGRHSSTHVPSFFDCDFSCADVHEDSIHDYEEDDQKNDCSKEHSDHNWDVQIFHGLSLSKFNWVKVDG